ncbi:E3 ubiquitin-protein ligase NEURL3-like isoform X3 [Scyliorhinus canicula]|uniref:E3 ubiquitin-protein ligase NEURL3-like isoform X3 n=1 Tax=Scyliorhinus canicula TaxID=7830 RepID=UPI0018F5013B|nr:E3 ubiquitin-protein ligase NEURL3-like isoform X3 [Scyliorhinus canicula]
MPVSMGNIYIKETPREHEQQNDQRRACGKKTKYLQKPNTLLSPLFFHPYTKGTQVNMDSSHHCAWRKSGFCNGIIFTNRPVLIQEKVGLKITKTDASWKGGLRLGCTIFDPSLMDPNALPKFVCPDLEKTHGFWVSALPQDCMKEGTVISFWVNSQGHFLYTVNEGREYLLMKGLLVSWPLWVIIDVYGTTQEVRLQGRSGSCPCAPEVSSNTQPQHSKSLDEDCILCCSHQVDSVLYKCGHMCVCFGCGKKLLGQNAKCPICRQPVKEIIKTYRS